MAGNCPRCHRYLGASPTCPDCDDPFGGAAGSPQRTGSPFAATSYPSGPPAGGPSGVVVPPNPTGSSGAFSVRGLVAGSAQVRQRFVPGTMLVRGGLAISWAALVYLKAADLVASTFWYLFWTLFPFLVLWLVVAALANRVGLGGCLSVPFTIRAPRVQPRDDGWRLDVQTSPTGGERVLVAASPPVDVGDEIVVHGPLLGGVRHAWLIQGVAPSTYTRVGRGLVGTLLLAVVLLPQIVWLLAR